MLSVRHANDLIHELWAVYSHQSIEIGLLPLTSVRSAGLCAHAHGGVYQREVRHDRLPMLHHALVLRRGRHSGGQSEGPDDERRRKGVADGDTEQPYKFLDKGNREDISSDSKVTIKTSKGTTLTVQCFGSKLACARTLICTTVSWCWQRTFLNSHCMREPRNMERTDLLL